MNRLPKDFLRSTKGFGLTLALAGAVFSASLSGEQKALLVGISDYPTVIGPNGKTRERDLLGPLNDVALMKQVLLKLGFKEQNIVILTDKQATTRGIIDAFKKNLIAGVSDRDSVVFYFSGHGSQVKDLNGDEKDNEDEVIITYDSVDNDSTTWMTDDRLGELLGQLPTQNAWIVFDCCHSGDGVRAGSTDEPREFPEGVLPRTDSLSYQDDSGGAREGFLDEVPAAAGDAVAKGLGSPSPYIFFGACQPDETAFEAGLSSQGKNGIFTFTLHSLVTADPGIAMDKLTKDLSSGVKSWSRKKAPTPQNPYYENRGRSGRLLDLLP